MTADQPRLRRTPSGFRFMDAADQPSSMPAYFDEHPLPWRVESGSPGVWIEDSGIPTVMVRIDPSFRREAEAMVAAVNAHPLAAMAKGMLDSLTVNAKPSSTPHRSCRHGINPDECEFCDGPGPDKEEAARQAIRALQTSSTPRSEPECMHVEFRRVILVDGDVGAECVECREAFAIAPAYGAPQPAAPPLDVLTLARVLREHQPDNRTSRRLCTCYEWEWRGNEKQYHDGWTRHIAAEYARLRASTEPERP